MRTSTGKRLGGGGGGILARLCKLRTKMAIYTYTVRMLASEASDEGLMMQARKIKYDVIELTETRRHQEKDCSSEHTTAGE